MWLIHNPKGDNYRFDYNQKSPINMNTEYVPIERTVLGFS